MPKKIIVFGAGYAGIEAALTLQKKKKKSDDLEITLIDRNSYHTLLTELHEVAGNRISEDGVIIPLRDIFKYTDVKLIKDEITGVDFNTNTVTAKSGEYHYDYLIIAAGSEPNYYNIHGLKENGFPLWSYDDSIRIREHIKECFVKASQESNPEIKRSLLTFVVGGGGFTGVEVIGEIAQWVKSLCREYDISHKYIRLVLVEALDKILNNLQNKSINKAVSYLTIKLGVEILTGSAISKVSADSIEINDKLVIPTNTLIWTAGVKASDISGKIDIDKAKGFRLKVNEFTQTQYKNVYAAGDISAFISEGHTLPALVEAAIQTGNAAAKNILADIRGKEKQELKPKLHGVMVSVGSFFAVTDIMGYQFNRLLSIAIKYLVNIHYLFGIGGFELVIRYIKHEFLFKQQEKFLIEKHYSMLTPTFWIVPIRLFLGYAWLKEGYQKILDGWLTTPMLAGTVDANSSASVTEAGEKVFRIISDHTPFWYAWIAQNFVIPNALVFQILIVLAEVGLGLAFISGTLNFIAGLAALALNVNFLLSTGLLESTWWMIPAEICMLAGAGRAFGVDYYLIPYLMRQWRYVVRNRRIKLWLFD